MTPTNAPQKARRGSKGRGAGIIIGASTPSSKSPRGEVITPPHVKVQRLPSPEFFGPGAQSQVSPRTKIVGGFATLGIGRYLP